MGTGYLKRGKEIAEVRDALAGRLGLTVPHEWWASAHQLKAFEAAGFGWVQVDSPPPDVLLDTRLLTRHAAATRAALDTTGLRSVIHAPGGLRLGGPASLRAMDGLIDYAAELGSEFIVYHALAVADGPATRDIRLFEEAALRRAGRRCEGLGIAIAVENLAPLYPGPETLSANPAALRALVRRVGSPAVGICVDLGHAHVVAERRRTSLTRLVEAALDLTILFHAHDNFGARHAGAGPRSEGVDPLRLDLHLPPGKGTLPWHEAASLITGRSAPVICEVHPPFRRRAAELHEDALILLRA